VRSTEPRMRTVSRAAALSLAGLTALGALAGCGALHPGVAVEAGDDTITLSRVDEVTRDVCVVVQSDPRSQGTYAMVAVRRLVVANLAMRLAAAQLAEQYDVSTGQSYVSQVKLYNQNLARIEPDVRANAIEVLTAPDYVDDIVGAVGSIELANEGVDDPTATDISDKGYAVLQSWSEEHGLEIDPRFGLALGDNGIVSSPHETSYALSDFATQAAADQPADTFASALPPSQRCG